ncbi:uncharacterized protein BO96DRAFT_13754 [Aspergillus niger CBS 101883]|uniref:uncharacterized protein n=1 Tax=Aspergillus lacticoffeatus (strain CBS 101883) TaxID=1450533 RepID=UPI000D7FA870|nr:uncharacterized protein BO96DRAFT_13754 [Aspergillus niger CBS 101883]PYH62455.1 hypothetical protein BO96DRAFT_13754 [Aspergillus niger CBS 101883]
MSFIWRSTSRNCDDIECQYSCASPQMISPITDQDRLRLCCQEGECYDSYMLQN